MFAESPSLADAVGVRTTRAADGQALRELRLEAISENPTAFGSSIEDTHEKDWTAQAERGAGGENEAVFVAEADGRLIGMTGIFAGTRVKDRHAASIWGVYVRPAWRGHRIADRLIGAAVDWARQKQLAIVRLTVVSDNAPAIACYTRCGFRVTGVDAAALAWEGRFYDELLMSMKLVGNG